jgi:cysteinyl-tRNA synthetase
MTLRLYNSLGREVVPFVPMKKGHVGMYTCGPTVWNYAHVGNYRTFVFEDLLRRYLKFKGFSVKQVMNITDVEDNIIKGMTLTGKSREELTSFYTKAFFEDIASLNVEPADAYPRASEHIPEMVAMVKSLMAKGHAYKAKDGSIYFAVSTFRDYGKLSGIKPNELKAGARVAQDHYEKEEANDFALWKAWDPADGDVFWETELGKGRPGWHIECSAMSMKYLGESFDIHTGGIDNKFPHHENEIAQSESMTGRKFVNFWLHADFLYVQGKEMHKSVGNVVYLRDLLRQGHDPLTVRLLFISARYRDPLNLTDASLAQSNAERERLQQLVRRLNSLASGQGGLATRDSSSADSMIKEFADAMDEDLNTPAALGALFTFAKTTNNRIDAGGVEEAEARRILEALRRVDGVLGVLRFTQEALPPPLMELIAERDSARRRKDFVEADRLRAELLQHGVIIEDTPRGTVWRMTTAQAS